ncbi:MAG: putative S-layer protein [archaeon]|jgi:hypothetical protein|nr:putative S-layer protein [archaeon]
MASKYIVISVFSLIALAMLLSFASAAALEITALSYSGTTSHNSDVTVTFNATYSGTVGIVTLNFSESSAGTVGSWTSLPSITTIANDSTPISFTAVYNIPAHASGTTYPVLKAKTNTTSPATDQETLTIAISSATTATITSKTALTTSQNGTINITNTGNTALANLVLSASGSLNVTLSSTTFTLAAGASTLVNVNAAEDVSDLELGSHDVDILLETSTGTDLATYTYSLTGYFCDYGDVNASDIDITDIEDVDSDDEWSWKPFDQIRIDVEIENNVGDDEDFVVELAIWDTDEDEFVEIDDETSLEEEVSIDEDDSETVTFEFTAPSELEDSDGRYVVYVKAYVDGDEDVTCNSESAESLEIERKANEVMLDDLTAPEIVQAGDTVRITGTAYNIGTKDEDKVYVQASNTKLGLSQKSSTFDIDSSESEDFDISFVVPYTAENGVYSIKLISSFSYSTSSDTYRKESDTYEVQIKVVGGVNTTTIPALTGYSQITPKLDDSNVVAGREMSVTATLKNLGSNKTTFILGVNGYDSWATLSSISDRIVTLDGGQSKDVKLVFAVNKDASGEKTFTIESTAGSNKVDSKLVAVNIASSSWFSSLKSKFSTKSSLIWIIGIINLILIILIIVVAVKLAKR